MLVFVHVATAVISHTRPDNPVGCGCSRASDQTLSARVPAPFANETFFLSSLALRLSSHQTASNSSPQPRAGDILNIINLSLFGACSPNPLTTSYTVFDQTTERQRKQNTVSRSGYGLDYSEVLAYRIEMIGVYATCVESVFFHRDAYYLAPPAFINSLSLTHTHTHTPFPHPPRDSPPKSVANSHPTPKPNPRPYPITNPNPHLSPFTQASPPARKPNIPTINPVISTITHTDTLAYSSRSFCRTGTWLRSWRGVVGRRRVGGGRRGRSQRRGR